MKILQYGISTLLLCVFLGGALSAQTEFSADPKPFLNELGEFMMRNKREDIEIEFKKFKKNYESGKFTGDQFKACQEVCNTMYGLKMQPAPFFLSYLTTINIVLSQDKSSAKIDEYNKVAKDVMAGIEKRNFNDYKAFLSFAKTFYESKAIRKGSSSAWRVDESNYDIAYKDKDLVVDFPSVTLIGIRKQDSIKIEQTKGSYHPFTDIWKGEGGRVSWERVGMDEVFVKLGTYEFEVKKNTYTSKGAVLQHPKYFPGQSIKGTFEDRIVVKSAGSKDTYPRFGSDDKVLEIDNIGANVKYRGGFKLNGGTVYGYGDKDNKAEITVLSSVTNKPVMKLRTLQFIIKEDVERIVSNQTETSLYFGADSIYHPSTNVRFEVKDKTITLQRGDRGSDRNPFFSSYHNIRLDADRLDWNVETDSILIGKKTVGIGGGNEKKAKFESYHYFSEPEYYELQNIADYNPIATIMAYSHELEDDELDAAGIAKKINPKFDAKSIERLLYQMVSRGFIEYDEETQTVYVQEKLKHYALSGVKKSDYDNISITSTTKETNAVLYINEKSENPIDIQAVNFLEFSEKQKVAVKPMNNQIMMKKDRDMDFSGKVFAGMTIFQGKDFHFDYEKFKIDMDSIRYFDVFENTGQKDENGDPIAYSIGSRIENVNGTLLIDAPNNKSSREDIPLFSSFSSKGPSYIYYDSPNIQDGVYKRDSFYFELKKFGFNNLDDYMPSDIKFKGTMYSADIFPVFKEKAILMPEDKSLGFVHKTPSEGYAAYVRKSPSGQGRFKGDIKLSNKGFEGSGNINYLQASVDSEDLIFKPNVTVGSARRFDLDEKRGTSPELPQVRGNDITLRWVPYRDSLYLKSGERAFDMYKSEKHTLTGTLILTPGGLRGNGKLDWDEAYMVSKDFLFGANSLTADSSQIAVKAIGAEGQIAFDSENVKADVDFDKGKGHFVSNLDRISTSMPYNKYKTSMNEFFWDMPGEVIEFKARAGKVDEFLSPELDSLRFQGATALYDIKTSTLKIGGVPFIKSADALVYTETGDVEIAAGGRMKTLENARIVASHTTQYHVINRATVNIKGGRDYTAKGYYEYNIGDKEQEILFSDIIGSPVGKGKRTEKALATRGSGTVKDKDEFFIDHKTRFRGDITLSSDEKDLLFDGYARLEADLPQKYWFTIKSKADKNDLAIAYENPKTSEGDPLKTGIFIDRALGTPYPSIMGILLARKDRALMDVTGVFKYDKREDVFTFGDSTKLTSSNHYTGNTFRMNNKLQTCTATGAFNIGEGVKFLKPTVVGQAKLNIAQITQDSSGQQVVDKQELEMDLMAGISYMLPEDAVKAMVKDLKGNLYDAAPITYNPLYIRIIPDILGGLVKNKTGYDQVYGNFKTTDKITLPATEKHLFFFSYLPMKWDPDLQSLVSREKKIGLSQIDGNSVSKMVDAYVEFRMPANTEDDGMHLYVKNPAAGGHYYYFKYKNGVLQTVSSNPAYNNAITGAKKKELTIKMGKEGTYTIEPTSPTAADMFVARVKGAW